MNKKYHCNNNPAATCEAAILGATELPCNTCAHRMRNLDLKKFSSKKKALEYAEEEIGKYDYEVVNIRGTKTILCSTGLPINELIRDRVEELFSDLVELVGNNPETHDDGILFLGAQTTDFIMKNLKKNLDIDVLSAFQDY